MTDWAVIQAGAYNTASKKARALSETIINSKLSRAELESVGFIIQLEIMKRKQQRAEKKIIHLEEYQGQQHQGPGSAAGAFLGDQQQGQAQGPEQAAPPEGQGAGSAAGAFLGPGSAGPEDRSL